tara:strand:- start:30 stop:434 length:405 start_codon:yes stop_codon:yes gene_type:complete
VDLDTQVELLLMPLVVVAAQAVLVVPRLQIIKLVLVDLAQRIITKLEAIRHTLVAVVVPDGRVAIQVLVDQVVAALVESIMLLVLDKMVVLTQVVAVVDLQVQKILIQILVVTVVVVLLLSVSEPLQHKLCYNN